MHDRPADLLGEDRHVRPAGWRGDDRPADWRGDDRLADWHGEASQIQDRLVVIAIGVGRRSMCQYTSIGRKAQQLDDFCPGHEETRFPVANRFHPDVVPYIIFEVTLMVRIVAYQETEHF